MNMFLVEAKKLSLESSDIFYITAEVVVGLLTIMVNGLVLAALCGDRNLHTVANCYIGSLVVANTVVGVGVAPLVIVTYTGLPRDFYACVSVNCLAGVFTTISILSIVGVAFDRYWVILHPVARLNVVTKRGALMMVAVIWILGTAIGLAPLMGLRNDPGGFDKCTYMRVIDLRYNVYLTFFGFKIPVLLAMLYVHVRIFYARRSRLLIKRANSNTRQSGARRTTACLNVYLFRCMVLIFTLFAICWIPVGIVRCIQLWSPTTELDSNLIIFLVLLSHFNTSITPAFYAISKPAFRCVIGLYLHACLTGDFRKSSSSKLLATAITVKRIAVASAAFSAGLTQTATTPYQATATATETRPITHDNEPVQDVEQITHDIQPVQCVELIIHDNEPVQELKPITVDNERVQDGTHDNELVQEMEPDHP